MKVLIIVGTRPEIIRLAPTINLCRQVFQTTLVHTGQNYDDKLNDIFFRDLQINPPDIYMDCCRDNSCAAIGDIISKAYWYMLENPPDCVLVLGDTNSCLAAYSAKRLKIPIFHLEAGNRCFDQNVPEEINRRIIDHLADVNICYMTQARENLLRENYPPERVFVIGSPIKEVFSMIDSQVVANKDSLLLKLGLDIRKYFVFSCHREENTIHAERFDTIISSLNQVAIHYGYPIICSIHPRIKNRLDQYTMHENIKLFQPFGLIDYYTLQMNSFCVISDSGTLTEESAILEFSSVLLRNSTEHPEGIDCGTIVIGNYSFDHLRGAIDISTMQRSSSIPDCYKPTDFSKRVINIIQGYTPIINHFTWKR